MLFETNGLEIHDLLLGAVFLLPVPILSSSALIALLILAFWRSPLATRLTKDGSTFSFLATRANSPRCATYARSVICRVMV